ncbi:hypothetical protein BDI4_830070 [Burkholderia diffusa]|nr:hypothetical protein BDI4_830070 [Burkholderia diffusa]
MLKTLLVNQPLLGSYSAATSYSRDMHQIILVD